MSLFYQFAPASISGMSVSNGHQHLQLNPNPLHFIPLKVLPLIFLLLKHRIRRNIWISEWMARESISQSKSLFSPLFTRVYPFHLCLRIPVHNEAGS